MTGFPIPPQLIAFGVIAIIIVGTIGVFVNNEVDTALITGEFGEGVTNFQEDISYFDESFYTGGKTNIPVKDTDGHLLYDIFIGEGSLSDTFDMFINGSEKGITTLEIAEYIPKYSVNLAYTTLIFALKMQCPAGVPVIQFIRIIDWGYNYQFSSLGTEMTDTFPEVKDYNTIYNNSEGNIVDDIISWVSAQIHDIIDKGFANWLVQNNWLIGIVTGFIAFIPIGPFKMF